MAVRGIRAAPGHSGGIREVVINPGRSQRQSNAAIDTEFGSEFPFRKRTETDGPELPAELLTAAQGSVARSGDARRRIAKQSTWSRKRAVIGREGRQHAIQWKGIGGQRSRSSSATIIAKVDVSEAHAEFEAEAPRAQEVPHDALIRQFTTILRVVGDRAAVSCGGVRAI